METQRIQLRSATRRASDGSSKDTDVLELNIDQLEERIAPLWNRRWI